MSRTSITNVLIGLILIGLGMAFTLIQFLKFDFWGFSWPFAVIGVGGVFFVAMVLGGKSASGLAVPGSVLSTIGLILLYQNTFGHWESWAYAWTLIFSAVGVGIWIMGAWDGRAETRRSGARVAGSGLILFLIFASFFELGLGFSGFFRASKIVWPLVMIVAGLYLIVFRGGLRSRKSLSGSSSDKSE
jgi:hypothetical protein